ncbi:hypothetical protein DB346_08010 [Verrucomicrobia bacterium LW23]|nr:hypothetical protein DB346_08010 [Verrucomicrobia bacterium LW23]
MIPLLLPMFVLISLYALLTASCLGWGWLAGRALPLDDKWNAGPGGEDGRGDEPGPEPWPGAAAVRGAMDRIWLGLFVVTALLAIAHIVVAISGYVGIVLYGGGVLLLAAQILRGKAAAHTHGTWIPQAGRGVALAMVVPAVLICWIALRALNLPLDWDSGLYHFHTIRWINEYPAVYGLGNLHERLAFNCTFFTFVASLNFYPWFMHGYQVAQSWLIIMCLVECWIGLCNILSYFRRKDEAVSFPVEDVLPAILLPCIIFNALAYFDVCSPQPNRASCILRYVVFIHFWRAMVDNFRSTHRVTMLFILTVLMMTTKINNVVFAFLIWLLVLIYYVVTSTNWRQLLAKLLAYRVTVLYCAILFGLYITHGYISSGYPLWPSSPLRLNTEWAIPRDVTQVYMYWLTSWAQEPHTPYDVVLSSNEWFLPWLVRLVVNDFTEVVAPILLFFIICICSILTYIRARATGAFKLWYLTCLLPLFGAIAFWFIYAPDTRYAEGYFWLLPGAILSICVAAQTQRPQLLGAIIVAFAVMCVPFFTGRQNLARYAFSFPPAAWQPLRTVPLTEKYTDQGVRIYVPTTGYQTWDAPLPCTIYFRPDLELLGEGLGSGWKRTKTKPHPPAAWVPP